MKKNIVSRILSIGAVGAILYMMILYLLPTGDFITSNLLLFSNNAFFPIISFLLSIITFSVIAALYLIVDTQLGGHRILKGITYGSACALLWVTLFQEPVQTLVPLERIVYGISIGIVLIIIGRMIGTFLANPSPVSKYFFSYNSIVTISVIALAFLVGRLLQYNFLHIDSLFTQDTLETLIWVFATGAVIGLLFDFLRFDKEYQPLKTSLLFGGLIIGVNFFLFNFQMFLYYNLSASDLFTKTLIDTAAIVIGTFISCMLYKQENKSEVPLTQAQ